MNENQEHLNFINIINNCPERKPKDLILKDKKWQYLVWSMWKGKNILMTGHSGCGKNLSIQALSTAFPERPFFKFNMGDSQDPKAMLIGNTHFNKDDGTYFAESAFIKAIQTDNAIILLDELSRIHPDGENILMTVLDEDQRYLRIDEMDGSPIIKVKDSVCFVATANIGSAYTATRILDRATIDRFNIIEMDLLNKEEEEQLMQMKFSNLNQTLIKNLAEVAIQTREAYKASKVSKLISTRAVHKMAELLIDGFSFIDVADIVIFPVYDDGDIDSERAFIKKIVEKFPNLTNISATSYTPPTKPVETMATSNENVKVEGILPWPI